VSGVTIGRIELSSQPEQITAFSVRADLVHGPGIALGPEITQFLCISQLPLSKPELFS